MTNLSKAAEALTRAGATKPCHRCDGATVSPVSFSHVAMTEMGNTEMIGIPIAGCIMTVCSSCGVFNLHSTVALGLEAPKS